MKLNSFTSVLMSCSDETKIHELSVNCELFIIHDNFPPLTKWVNAIIRTDYIKHPLHILPHATEDWENSNSEKEHNLGTYSYYLVSNMNTAILIYSTVFCYALNKNARGLWGVSEEWEKKKIKEIRNIWITRPKEKRHRCFSLMLKFYVSRHVSYYKCHKQWWGECT